MVKWDSRGRLPGGRESSSRPGPLVRGPRSAAERSILVEKTSFGCVPGHGRRACRLARLAAGAAVVAATSATTLLTAAPAHAATPVTVSKSSPTVMRINGSDVGESVQIRILNGALTVSNTLGSVQAGSGCVQLGGAVRCDGVTAISYEASGGDDSFRNNTSLRVTANGGPGNDRYTGGPGQDAFRGESGSDVVNGGNGTDFCDAETESACERELPPRIRVPR